MKKQKIYLLEVSYDREYRTPVLEVFEGDIKEHIKYMRDIQGATLRIFKLNEVRIK